MSDAGKPELLFKHKAGTVTATVWGPRIGFCWRRIEYVRWQLSTRQAGKFEPRAPDRECDQVHLHTCVKAVRKWLKNEDPGRPTPSPTA